MSVINTNVKSLIAQDSLRANNNKLATAMERLSTGSKINSAKDDAAGLAIGTRMTSQVRGLNMAIKNANDGMNLAQTAEGAMTEVTDMLQRMRELAVQAGNSTNSDTDRAAMNEEVNQLKSEINRIASTTQFNGMNIMDGSFQGKALQIGNNANQTMEIGVKSVSTSSMGETAAGLAVGATKAKVQIAGASGNVADYQGASFNVNVNGVAKTVTLPVSTPGNEITSGAKATPSLAVADVTADLSVHGQVGALDSKFLVMTTPANGKLEITVNGGVKQTIDITDEAYYKVPAKATGEEVVAALQAEMDANSSLQGVNKVNVSLDQSGRVKFEMASGTGAITLNATVGTSVLLTQLGGTDGDSTLTGAVTVSEPTKSVASTSSFDVGNNHFDLLQSIQDHGYDAAKLTADQFVTVYNDTAKVNGVSVSSVTKSEADGTLTFTNNPTAPVGSPFNNGSLVTTISDLGAADHVSIVFQDASTTFGKAFDLNTAITVAANTNDVLSIQVEDGPAVDLRLRAQSVTNLTDMAAEIQDEVNKSGAFTGENAVTVTASKDADGKIGISFANAAGKSITLDGNMLSHANSTALFTGTAVEGTISKNSTDTSITINHATSPTGVGFEVMKQRTKDLSATDIATFSIDVNGAGAVDIDLSSYITDAEYDDATMTGAQLVGVLNTAFADTPALQGRNGVTASLNANGRIVLQANGTPAGGGTASIVIDDHSAAATAGDNLLKGLLGAGTAKTSDVSGQLVIETAQNQAEYFGVADVTLATASGNTKVQVTLGDGNPVELTLDEGVYTNAQAFADEINTRLQESQAFTGQNAITVSVTTRDDGSEGLLFQSASGTPVTVGGELITDAQGFNLSASLTEITFPGIREPLGGVDLSGDNSMTLSVTDANGGITTKSFDLASTGNHVSLSDYADLLKNAANAAFADEGVTFSASYQNGQLSFQADQTSVASLSASGGAVSAAFGGAIIGNADVRESDVNKFTSMSDVAAAINADLGDAAIAEYDDATGWSFTVAAGSAGVTSNISLSGAGLGAVQFGGALSATGGAGNATAAKLADIDVLTTDKATSALASIDNSIQFISDQRANLGAIQNRLEHTVNNLTNIVTNTEASRSAIMDADYSKETTALAKSQILTQAATAMLAQANQSSQGVLSLLK